MSNKETLQENNAELAVCLALAESLPDAGSSGSGGSCTCYSVPIQKFEYTNEDMTSGTINHHFVYTEVAENTLKAILHVAGPEYMACGGFPSLVLSSDNPTYPEAIEEVYCSIIHAENYSDQMSIQVSMTPPISITFSHSVYYTPPSDWFIEITVKTDTREIWVIAREMNQPDNY